MQLTQISGLVVHDIGNPHYELPLNCSNELFRFKDEMAEDVCLSLLLNKMETPAWFAFNTQSDFSIYRHIKSILEQPETLLEGSKEIAEELYRCLEDVNPSLSGGHLWIGHLTDMLLNEELIDGLIISFTSETSDFLQFSKVGTTPYVNTEKGFQPDKVDAMLLVYNLDAEEGYNCKMYHRNTKPFEFWPHEFLKLVAIEESYHETKTFLDMAKNFVKSGLPESQDIEKADQAEILNNTIHYFKERERYDANEFVEEVFADDQVADSFNEFQQTFSEGTGMKFEQGFDISDAAVKKQSRIFKSVLKLDKNFHVYIHGNRKMIERGVDQDGKKYYKLYYDSEK